jgi:DNA-directed RNA polymerase specialized sigma24 family protein
MELAWDPKFGDMLELHEALDGLAAFAPESAELVKLRCFAGQSFPEAAALLGISVRTAKRRWAFARAWLYKAIRGAESKDHSSIENS